MQKTNQKANGKVRDIARGAALLVISALLAPSLGLADGGMYVDGTGSELGGGKPPAQATAAPGSTTAPSATNPPAATLPPGGAQSGDTADETVPSEDGTPLSEEETPPAAEEGGVFEPWVYEATPLSVMHQGKPAILLVPGVYTSTIATSVEDPDKGQVMTRLAVPAREVSFESSAPVEKTLAVVENTKSGYIKLHKASSVKSVVLEKPGAGQVLPVLSAGKRFTKVNYLGCVGFVRTDFLQFCAPADTDVPKGQIAYRGNPNSRNTVKVRAEGNSGSRVVGEYPCGTEVSVIEPGEKWTKIEVNGVQCFILSTFLMVEGAADAAGAVPTGSPAPEVSPPIPSKAPSAP